MHSVAPHYCHPSIRHTAVLLACPRCGRATLNFVALQAAMLGNTAFLSSVAIGEIGATTTELVLTVRNHVTVPGGSQARWNRFQATATQLFVEVLPLVPTDKKFERLDDADDVLFAHKVWPPKTSAAAFASGAFLATDASSADHAGYLTV